MNEYSLAIPFVFLLSPKDCLIQLLFLFFVEGLRVLVISLLSPFHSFYAFMTLFTFLPHENHFGPVHQQSPVHHERKGNKP